VSHFHHKMFQRGNRLVCFPSHCLQDIIPAIYFPQLFFNFHRLYIITNQSLNLTLCGKPLHKTQDSDEM
jgi:hypothetical protein